MIHSLKHFINEFNAIPHAGDNQHYHLDFGDCIEENRLPPIMINLILNSKLYYNGTKTNTAVYKRNRNERDEKDCNGYTCFDNNTVNLSMYFYSEHITDEDSCMDTLLRK